MAFNINEFRANLDKSGIYNPSDFRVMINKGDSTVVSDNSFRCQATELPGRAIATAELKTSGPIQKIGYESIFSELVLSFILDETLSQKDFFETWQNEVLGNYRDIEGVDTSMFNLGYFDDYVARVTVENYSQTGNITNRYTYEEAYPTSVGDISLSWQSGSELALLPVTFSYTYFRKERI